MTIDELVAESRARQGLPPKVTDPGTIARLAALIGHRKAPPASDLPGGATSTEGTGRAAASTG